MDNLSELMCKKVIEIQTGEIGTVTGIDYLEGKLLVDFEKGGSEWLSLDELSLCDF